MILSFAPEAGPPRRLKRRLLAAVGLRQRNWNWIAWAATTAALLVGIVWLEFLFRRNGAELAEAQRVLEIVNSPETRAVSFGAGPRGNVFVNPKKGVLLIAANLPRLDAGRVFEMWVIPKGGAPKPAGLFRADAGGQATHVLAGTVDLQATGAVAVTVEPEAGSAAPTSQPIIVAPVTGS